MNHLRVGMLIVLLVTLAAGCGSGDDDAATPASRQATPTSTQLGSPIGAASPTASPGTVTPTQAAETTSSATPGTGAYQLVDQWGAPVSLVSPGDLAIDPDGRLITGDRLLNSLVVFESGGELESSWSIGNRAPWDIAVDPAGAIVTTTGRSHSPLLKYDHAGTLLGELVIEDDPERPTLHISDLAIDSDGYLYVASGLDPGTGQQPAPFEGVIVLDPQGQKVATWAAPTGVHPQQIVMASGGVGYITFYRGSSASPPPFHSQILPFRRDTEPVADWSTAIELIDEVDIDGLAIAPDGTLVAVTAAGNYEGEPSTTHVWHIDAGGAILAEWALENRIGAPFAGAVGVAVDRDGVVYLSDPLQHRILKLNSEGQIAAEIGAVEPGQFAEPAAVSVAPDGRVYVLDQLLDLASVYDADGTLTHTWYVSDRSLSGPGEQQDLAIDAQNNLYVSNDAPGTIIVLTPSGDVRDEWSPPISGNPPDVFQADHFVVGADGNLYTTTIQDAVTRVYSPAGDLLKRIEATAEAGEVSQILDIATDGVALFVLVDASSETNSIDLRRINADGSVEVVTSFAVDQQPAPFFPTAIALDAAGNIFLADSFTRSLLKLDASGNELARRPVEVGDPARRGWLSIAVGHDGTLYVADTTTRQIWVYAP